MLRAVSIVSAAGFSLFSSVVFLFFGYCFVAFYVIMSSNSGLLGSALTELLPLALLFSGNTF